jgi:hypothetical protein
MRLLSILITLFVMRGHNMLLLKQIRKRFSSSTTTAINSVANLPNHRFWTHEYTQRSGNGSTLSIPDELDLSRVEMGVVWSSKANCLLPIIEGTSRGI